MKPKEMLYINNTINNIESNNNTHTHIDIYIYIYRNIHIYSIIWYNACNVNVTCGKRETEAKFQSHLFRAFFGNLFLTPPFHPSWFTTAARVTLNKPPSCCQRQWHHYKRWGLCQIEDGVISCHLCFASNFDWKSHLKFPESQDDCHGLMYRSRVTSCDILFSRFVAKIIHGPSWQLLVPISHKGGLVTWVTELEVFLCCFWSIQTRFEMTQKMIPKR